jgi:iron complex transport system ATP-binding protein
MGPPRETLTPEMLRRLYGIDVAVTFLSDIGRHVCTPSLKRLTREGPA